MSGWKITKPDDDADDSRHSRRVFLLVIGSIIASVASVLQLGVGSDPSGSTPADGGSEPVTFGYGGTPVLDTSGSTGTSTGTTPTSETTESAGGGGSGGGGGGDGGGGGGTTGTPTGSITSPSTRDLDYGFQGYGEHGYGGVAT